MACIVAWSLNDILCLFFPRWAKKNAHSITQSKHVLVICSACLRLLSAGKPLPPQPPAPETLGVDKSKTPQWEVVVNVHSISLIMEKLPPFGYKALGSGPDLGTVSHCRCYHLRIMTNRERPTKSKAFVSLALKTFVHHGSAYLTPFETQMSIYLLLNLKGLWSQYSKSVVSFAAFKNTTLMLPVSRHSASLFLQAAAGVSTRRQH